MKVIITIPLPPVGCSPNGGISRHWATRARHARLYRQEAYVCALRDANAERMMLRKAPLPALVSAVFYQGATKDRRYRPLDVGNAITSLKHAIDGLVDAGLLPNDGHKWLNWGSVALFRGAKQHQGRAEVVLTLTYGSDA